jgi:hypothetical protein
MTTLLNIDQLYGSLQSAWGKIQADVFSHLLLFLVLFGFIGVTVPAIPLRKIDPQQLMENSWFVLAKETNTLLLIPVAVIVIVLLYGALLRIVGSFLWTLQGIVLAPENYGPLLLRNAGTDNLSTIAMTLEKEDFTLDEILNRTGELSFLYRAKRPEDVKSFEEGLGKLSKNAGIYTGNVTMFLLVWILLFILLPDTVEWKKDNQEHFWLVSLLLTGALMWTWVQARRALRMLPIVQTVYISLLLRSDPDMKDDLSQSNNKYSKVRERIGELESQQWEKLPRKRPPREKLPRERPPREKVSAKRPLSRRIYSQLILHLHRLKDWLILRLRRLKDYLLYYVRGMS